MTPVRTEDGWPPLRRAFTSALRAPGTERFIRIAVNLAGAVTAALFAQASVRFYLHTHRLIGGLFVIEQAWFAVAFLTRRPPQAGRALAEERLLASSTAYQAYRQRVRWRLIPYLW